MPASSDISEAEYGRRISKAQTMMDERGLDAILVASPMNAYYFTGLDSLIFDVKGVEQDMSWALVLRRKDPPVMILPWQFRDSFEAGSWMKDIKTYQSVLDASGDISKVWKELGMEGKTVGAELKRSHQMHEEIFLELARRSKFVDGTRIISQVRMVKSKEELDRIRKASQIAFRAFERLVPQIKEGMREYEVTSLLSAYMYEEGASPYYALMRSGEKYLKRLILSPPSDRKLRKGDWMHLEWAAEYRHYKNEAKSDLVLGAKPSEEEYRLYNTYVTAMKKGIDTARPGNTCSDVFKAVIKVFTDSGYKAGYQYRQGHGTGLEPHELPNISLSDMTKLEPGMVQTVEPWGVGDESNKASRVTVSNTTIVTSGAAERLPPLMEEIILI